MSSWTAWRCQNQAASRMGDNFCPPAARTSRTIRTTSSTRTGRSGSPAQPLVLPRFWFSFSRCRGCLTRRRPSWRTEKIHRCWTLRVGKLRPRQPWEENRRSTAWPGTGSGGTAVDKRKTSAEPRWTRTSEPSVGRRWGFNVSNRDMAGEHHQTG